MVFIAAVPSSLYNTRSAIQGVVLLKRNPFVFVELSVYFDSTFVPIGILYEVKKKKITPYEETVSVHMSVCELVSAAKPFAGFS
jgi:hypothetical protein